MTTKICRICNEVKLKDQFSMARFNHDGLDNRCKQCVCNYRNGRPRTTGERRKRTSDELADHIHGPYPKPEEISIYYLSKIETGEIFYVGQTNYPVRRSAEHRKSYGNVRMHIIRNVSEDQAFYWECKTVVDTIDAGWSIINRSHGALDRGLHKGR